MSRASKRCVRYNVEIHNLLSNLDIVGVMKDIYYLVLNSIPRPQPSSILSELNVSHNWHNIFTKWIVSQELIDLTLLRGHCIAVVDGLNFPGRPSYVSDIWFEIINYA